jgi:hypothetical protein
LAHIDAFAHPDLVPNVAAVGVAPVEPEDVDAEVLRELRRAEAHFAAGGGFVGAHYFIHRWKGHAIPDGPEARRQAVQRLMTAGRIVTYAVDGKTALRTAETDEVVPDTSSTPPLPEAEVPERVDVRMSETLVRRLRARLDE